MQTSVCKMAHCAPIAQNFVRTAWLNDFNTEIHFPEKHGTCSAPVVQDELQYFTIALDLYFKYNVTVSTHVVDILIIPQYWFLQ